MGQRASSGVMRLGGVGLVFVSSIRAHAHTHPCQEDMYSLYVHTGTLLEPQCLYP